MAKNEYTLSEIKYLKAIYNLAATEPKKISLKMLSDFLDTQPPSVHDKMQRMAEKKMVVYDRPTGIRLTEKGQAAALAILRRRGLWAAFLVEKLSYGPDQAQEMAEQLESAEGRGLDDRLDKYMGYPKTDPHGNLIPKAGI